MIGTDGIIVFCKSLCFATQLLAPMMRVTAHAQMTANYTTDQYAKLLAVRDISADFLVDALGGAFDYDYTLEHRRKDRLRPS
jgi:hypothetical protein